MRWLVFLLLLTLTACGAGLGQQGLRDNGKAFSLQTDRTKAEVVQCVVNALDSSLMRVARILPSADGESVELMSSHINASGIYNWMAWVSDNPVGSEVELIARYEFEELADVFETCTGQRPRPMT